MEIVVVTVISITAVLALLVAGSIPFTELSVALAGACINKPVLRGNIGMLTYPRWLWQFRRWQNSNQGRVEQIQVYKPYLSSFWYAEAEGFQYFHSSAAKAKRVIAATMFVADRTGE